ncbi:MAG: 3-methyl-2-oxobutanoate hydroxymethyltransferase [Verrucomicrobiales bacterium]|jgi:3-methyl-2-oxobutanoate hydroxymethyltransferase
MTRYGIALGSNLGDRLRSIEEAKRRLSVSGRILASAPIYKSAPVDCAAGDPDFYNTALEFETDLDPLSLLEFTQGIERSIGRKAEPHPNAPREIDIDLLYHLPKTRASAALRLCVSQFQSPRLQLPHLRLLERRFVLHPLNDIRPDLVIENKTIADHLATLQSEEPPLVMVSPCSSPERLDRLAAAKAAGEQIVAITAYDYPTARLLDEAGVDLILVGDSLGMVVLGHEDTTSVTLDMMLHHTKACRRGIRNAILIADLPIGTYDTPDEALASAQALSAAGADAVKLEGGLRQIEKVDMIVAAGIRIIGHIGMLPQRVREEGGYKKKGKTGADLDHIVAGAQALEKAGVDAIIIESTVPAAATRCIEAVDIPIIGIGAGRNCDGQIRVVHDVLGSYPWFVPKFAKTHADIAGETTRAAKSYIDAVRAKERA